MGYDRNPGLCRQLRGLVRSLLKYPRVGITATNDLVNGPDV